jgi:hypothetical protein
MSEVLYFALFAVLAANGLVLVPCRCSRDEQWRMTLALSWLSLKNQLG